MINIILIEVNLKILYLYLLVGIVYIFILTNFMQISPLTCESMSSVDIHPVKIKGQANLPMKHGVGTHISKYM